MSNGEEHVGKYVWCFQKFKDEELTDTPYRLKIVGCSPIYWKLEGPLGEDLRAHKGACSTNPFKLEDSKYEEQY